ncbi:GerAB/ArcD/ProY family transporter [Cohnella soli]|uniref:Endospore germination permease n=1 Tax=Cohnella soli TaxID=425005 RepID=A0ABW0HS78_9BACL
MKQPVTRNGITLMQYVLLLHAAQVGTGVFSMPRQLAETSGTDGWICLLIAWAINGLVGWLMILSFRKYPDLELPDLLKHLFGKWLGKLLLLPIIAYFAYFSWITMINAMLYIRSWFLIQTPEYVTVFLFAIPSYMILVHGPRILSRYAELVFYLTMWMPLILLVPMNDARWIHLLPVLKEGWKPVMDGLGNTLYSFSGFEILPFFYPYLQKKQYAVHGMLVANTLTVLFYLFVTIVCFMFFPPDGITTLNQPLLTLMKNIEFRFLERFDMIFLALYLFVVSKAWLPFVYCSLRSVSSLIGINPNRTLVALYLGLVIFSMYLLQPTWNDAENWQKPIVNAEKIVLIVLPVALYFYVIGLERIRKWRAG